MPALGREQVETEEGEEAPHGESRYSLGPGTRHGLSTQLSTQPDWAGKLAQSAKMSGGLGGGGLGGGGIGG